MDERHVSPRQVLRQSDFANMWYGQGSKEVSTGAWVHAPAVLLLTPAANPVLEGHKQVEHTFQTPQEPFQTRNLYVLAAASDWATGGSKIATTCAAPRPMTLV